MNGTNISNCFLTITYLLLAILLGPLNQMYPADTDVPNPHEEILCKQSTYAFDFS